MHIQASLTNLGIRFWVRAVPKILETNSNSLSLDKRKQPPPFSSVPKPSFSFTERIFRKSVKPRRVEHTLAGVPTKTLSSRPSPRAVHLPSTSSVTVFKIISIVSIQYCNYYRARVYILFKNKYFLDIII